MHNDSAHAQARGTNVGNMTPRWTPRSTHGFSLLVSYSASSNLLDRKLGGFSFAILRVGTRESQVPGASMPADCQLQERLMAIKKR